MIRVKVFFSQPHKERSHDEMLKASAIVVEKVKQAHPDANVLEVPMLFPDQFKGQHPVYYLGMNLQMMCQADVVVFDKDWADSRPCAVQHDICEEYGILHVDLECSPEKWDGK